MNKEQHELFEKELQAFGDRHSLTRIKTESLQFDHDYKRGDDNQFKLVSLKAVVRTLGKTTKVRIGEDEEHQSYETAAAAVKLYWSTYFKERRNRRTPAERKGEARRQRRYRERQRDAETAISQRQ